MRFILFIFLALGAVSCTQTSPASLCERFFTPYPDHISSRQRNALNSHLVDAMACYAKADYAQAIIGLQGVLDKDPFDHSARIYMASAQLAAGHPYKAEMHLDFLENYDARSYSDQVEWYNALCWLCEGDTAKAGEQARWIASRKHTYRKQAKELAEALSQH